jgi:hypothetical protein
MAKNKSETPHEGDGINGTESVEHAPQQTRGSNREKHSGQQSSNHGPRAFTQNQIEDIALLGAFRVGSSGESQQFHRHATTLS